MFYVDKYKITSINDIIYHKDIYEKLLSFEKMYLDSNYNNIILNKNEISNIKIDNFVEKIEHDNFRNFSNLLVYGPEQSGKKTVVKLLLNKMYGCEVKTKSVEYTITNYGNSNIKIQVEQSNFHIEIDPTNKGIDKYIIQDIIGQYIKFDGMKLFKNNMKYRLVIINNVQNLSYYAQTSLRRMMEKYVRICRFIIIGNQISKIIEPLKSRCVPIKLRAPTNNEIFDVLYNIIQKEHIKIELKQLIEICDKSNRNIKKGIWLLQMYNDIGSIDYYENWKLNINEIVNLILKINHNTVTETILDRINEYIYKIYITAIPPEKILNEILNNILSKIKDDMICYNIIELAIIYNYRVTNGKRSINHLEGFIIEIINLLNK